MITSMHHSAFTVSSLEDTMYFFGDLLGLQTTPIIDLDDERLARALNIPGAVMRVTFIITPDNRTIEFVEYVKQKGGKVDLKTCNVGAGHLAFVVDDVQKMYDDLTAKGVKSLNPPVWLEENNMGVCFMIGPDGIPIELLQGSTG